MIIDEGILLDVESQRAIMEVVSDCERKLS